LDWPESGAEEHFENLKNSPEEVLVFTAKPVIFVKIFEFFLVIQSL
jgi:hypothetical protein